MEPGAEPTVCLSVLERSEGKEKESNPKLFSMFHDRNQLRSGGVWSSKAPLWCLEQQSTLQRKNKLQLLSILRNQDSQETTAAPPTEHPKYLPSSCRNAHVRACMHMPRNQEFLSKPADGSRGGRLPPVGGGSVQFHLALPHWRSDGLIHPRRCGKTLSYTPGVTQSPPASLTLGPQQHSWSEEINDEQKEAQEHPVSLTAKHPRQNWRWY